MHVLGDPLISSFVERSSNPNVFHLLPGNSLVTLSSPYPIIRYKILINALTFSVEEVLFNINKNCRLIITNNIEK